MIPDEAPILEQTSEGRATAVGAALPAGAAGISSLAIPVVGVAAA